MNSLVVFIVVILIQTKGIEQQYVHECVVWDKEAKRVMSEPRLDVTCKKNSQCTGLDCTGKYSYSGPLSNNNKYEKDICFGVWINPCHTPTDLHLYLEQTSDNASFAQSFFADGHNTVDIPGMSEDIEIPKLKIKAAHATVTLDVYIRHFKKGYRNYMTIGVSLKPKVVYAGLFTEYPEELQVDLIKNVSVTVPGCNTAVKPPTHKPHTCGDTDKAPPIVPLHCGKMTRKLCNDEGFCHCLNTTLLQICSGKESSFKACPNNQGCFLSDAKNQSYCGCVQNFVRSEAGDCVFSSTTSPTIPMLPDDTSDNKSGDTGNKKNVIIIAVCAVVAISLAAAATIFVVWRYRKHRSRYAQHTLLRNADDRDDDDVPPIDLNS